MPVPDIVLLTDLPDWVAPLADRLKQLGARVHVATDLGESPPDGLLVNRVSASKAAEDPAYSRHVEDYLREQQALGRVVINGAVCHRLGYDKLEQARLFESCGVATPLTRPVVANQRAIPDREVLLKPLAGSYGRGIVPLGAGEPLPESLAGDEHSFLEQERIEAVDGAVHRVEILGDEILYLAVTPLRPGSFDYCLACGGLGTTLSADLDVSLAAQVLRVARQAGMAIGSIEYLLGPNRQPCFIDLNPVSGHHPGVTAQLGFDPAERVASWLRSVSRGDAVAYS